MASAVNELNVTKEEIKEAISSGGCLVKGMDQVIKTLAKDHDIIIISGSFQESAKIFLAKYDLLDCIQEIFSKPSTITDEGRRVQSSDGVFVYFKM